jgi:hypothetical protein
MTRKSRVDGKSAGSLIDKDGKAHWTIVLTSTAFVLFVVASFLYLGKSEIVNENEVAAIQDLVINDSVARKRTKGKNASYYYAFKFRGYDNEFRFFEKYYRYSDPSFANFYFNSGDTISIQILKKDLKNINDYNAKGIMIVNLSKGKRFYIDHKTRNEQIDKRNKKFFDISLSVFAGSLAVTLIWIINNKEK